MKDKIILTTLAGAFLVLAAAMVGGRYETVTALQGAVVRTDKLTGKIVACDAQECWAIDAGKTVEWTP